MIVNIAPGALVRDPVTKLALEDGATVDPNDPYVTRALLDGDLVAADETEPAAPSVPARSSRSPKEQASNSNAEDQA